MAPTRIGAVRSHFRCCPARDTMRATLSCGENSLPKFISVVGARPNFMKIAPIVAEFGLRPEIENYLVHTGQHYDDNLSRVFFDGELKLNIS